MPSVRIKKELKDRLYFVTFTARNWYYIYFPGGVSCKGLRFKVEDSASPLVVGVHCVRLRREINSALRFTKQNLIKEIKES